jgi:hypothetical protein
MKKTLLAVLSALLWAGFSIDPTMAQSYTQPTAREFGAALKSIKGFSSIFDRLTAGSFRNKGRYWEAKISKNTIII